MLMLMLLLLLLDGSTEDEGTTGEGLLVGRGWARRLDGEELEAELVTPVLLEEAGPLDRDLDVVTDFGLVREPRQRRRQSRLDVP